MTATDWKIYSLLRGQEQLVYSMSLHILMYKKVRMTEEKESGEIKGEYQMEREGCVQSLVIYHHLHLQDQVS